MCTLLGYIALKVFLTDFSGWILVLPALFDLAILDRIAR